MGSRSRLAKARRDDTPLFEPVPDPQWAGIGKFMDRPDLVFKPHRHQREALHAIAKGYDRGLCSSLLVMPTGTGKTVVFALFIKYVTEVLGWRVLIVAHLDELLIQARNKLRSYGVEAAIEKAELHALDEIQEARDDLFNPRNIRVVLGSRQTMTKRRLRKKWEGKNKFFNLIVIDEAHHATAVSYTNIIGWFDSAIILGVTATPKRADRTDLGEVFQDIIFQYPLRLALDEEMICKPIQRKLKGIKIDLKNIDITKNDYDEEELAIRMEQHLLPMANRIIEDFPDRKILIFTPKVRTAITLADMINAVSGGRPCRSTHGDDPNRAMVAKEFEQDEFRILVNCALYTEGYDCPSVDAIGLLRPTKSAGLLMQMVGRGLRPGKPDCILFDPGWVMDRHKAGMANLYELFARPNATPEAVELARLRLEDEEDEVDLTAEIDQAEEDEKKQRDKSELMFGKKGIKTRNEYKETHYSNIDIDILSGYRNSPTQQQFDGSAPSYGSSASAQQIQKLKQLGMYPSEANRLTHGQAGRMIQTMIARHNQGLISINQVRLLVSKGLSLQAANVVKKKEFKDVLDKVR